MIRTSRTLPLVAALAMLAAGGARTLPAQDAGRGASRAAPTGDPAAGEATFKAICSVCHTTAPPPKLAPPLAMVSQHYRGAFATEREALAAMTQFILAPDTLRMTLPKHAQQRFGVMPKLPLSEQQARDVAAYVWSLSAKPAAGHDH